MRSIFRQQLNNNWIYCQIHVIIHVRNLRNRRRFINGVTTTTVFCSRCNITCYTILNRIHGTSTCFLIFFDVSALGKNTRILRWKYFGLFYFLWHKCTRVFFIERSKCPIILQKWTFCVWKIHRRNTHAEISS